MKLLLIFLAIYSYSHNAFSIVGLQLGTGGLTPHFTDEKRNYCNQWNNTGVIVNKSYYLKLLMGDLGLSYIRGNDSICSEIEGLMLHYTMGYYEFWEIGVTAGGYAYNENNWEDYAAKTPEGIAAPAPVSARFYGRAIVPVLALDFNVHLIRRDNWSLKLNNLLTPVITNHSIAWEYRFE